MEVELGIIVFYAIGLILLYSLGWILLIPLKWIIRGIWNGILGGILLFILNIAGGFWGLSLAINPLNAIIVGLLGIPGVILLLLLKYIL